MSPCLPPSDWLGIWRLSRGLVVFCFSPSIQLTSLSVDTSALPGALGSGDTLLHFFPQNKAPMSCNGKGEVGSLAGGLRRSWGLTFC